jgi:hypothetical protein
MSQENVGIVKPCMKFWDDRDELHVVVGEHAGIAITG